MDLEEQGTIKRVVESHARDQIVVLLGTPTKGSTMMIALTLTQGDPSYAGPLAGVPLGLPIYHILEPEVRGAIPAEVYDREIGPLDLVLDGEGIGSALQTVRANPQ
jgi:glycine/sarcosine/betaine reductase complex component A